MPEYGILFVNSISPLHNGAGVSLGLIDNPIIRERTTAYPIIQASSLKGVLRDKYEEKLVEPDGTKERAFVLFGPTPEEGGSEYAGAISFSEGQLLAFPIRSLKGNFVWATSALALTRFNRCLKISNVSSFSELDTLVKTLKDNNISANVQICKSEINSILVSDKLILEEFSYSAEENELLTKFASQLSSTIFQNPKQQFLKSEFDKKLVLLADDTFNYFIQNATEVTPNIKINDKTGTTQDGSLRYTEYLPSETILYSLLTFEKGRNPNSEDLNLDNSQDVRKLFAENKPSIIQVGGDETTGKGLVHLTLINGENNDK